MGERLNVAKVFVLHVKTGYEQRRQSIERQLSKLNLEFEFMLDGDIPDITSEIRQRWFLPNLISRARAMSCTYKHFLIYQRLLQENWAGVLVLEDDILLARNFVSIVNASLRELSKRDDVSPAKSWISYENSTLRFPDRRIIKADQLLYRAQQPRCTGAYYLGRDAAGQLLHLAQSEKVNLSIDCFVTEVVRRDPSQLELYWCHPTVAEQGSMNGRFDSMDILRPGGFWRRLKWTTDKWYKSLRHRLQR